MKKKSKLNVFTFMLLIIIGLTFQPAISTYAVCPDDMTTYFKLDEPTAGTYTDFINGKVGTGKATNSPTPFATGAVKGAQLFDGNSTTGINVPADRSFNWQGNESFSIEFLVKTNGRVFPDENWVIIGRDDDDASLLSWWVGVNKTDGLPSFLLKDTKGNGPAFLSGVGDISLTDGNWHHVVAVRDGINEINIIYVDGFEKSRTVAHTYTAGFGSNAADLNIGWFDESTGFYFDGLIDEVALYDRALDEQEIEDHSAAALAVPGEDYCEGSAAPVPPNDAPFPDDTISLWKLDETVGSDYADDFGDNHGTGKTTTPPTPFAAGAVNGAQLFYGNSTTGINVPADRSFDWLSNESFSIEFLVKTNGRVFPDENWVIIGRDDDDASLLSWWVGVNKTDGLPSFLLKDTKGNGPAFLSGVGDISLTDGNWHHVVAVRDGINEINIIYVDGVEKDRTVAHTYTAGFGSNAAGLTIGWFGSGFYFDGLIDEVALYDRALDEQEIKDHSAAALAVPGEGIASLRPAPVADAGDDQSDIKETTVVTLVGTGSVDGYAEATITTYLWVQTDGPDAGTITDADKDTATFTAPDIVAAAETLTFQLTVTADDGQSDSDTVDISVVAMIPPVADPGDDQNVTEGDTVTLVGSGTDADGTIVTYLWEQTPAPTTVTLTGADKPTATFTAPQVDLNGTTLTFQLTVTDSDGLSHSDTMEVKVTDLTIPVADAGPDRDVKEGDTVTLVGSGTDADGTIASYSWEQTGGTEVDLIDAASDTATFAAPEVGSNGETLTFQLTVTDNDGLTNSDSMDVKVVDSLVAVDKIADFVTRFYRLILGREPDSAGLNGWTDDLSGGTSTGCDIAFGFVFSPEFINRNTTDEAYVDILYQAFFNRTADLAGKNGWLNVLQSGAPRGDVLNGFLFSQEFANLADSFGIIACKASPDPRQLLTDFVTRFYRLILDREPDSAGLNGWTDDLSSGTSTGCDIAFGFVFSPEFINRNTSDEAYVDILYQAFFNRAADIAGKNGWLNILQSGGPRGDVLNGFLFSQEFADLADSFGIIACAGGPV